MKKMFVVVVAVVLFVVSSFAEKGDLAIDLKGGVDITNDFQPIVATELFYEFKDTLSIGFGINYFFDNPTDLKNNIYLSLEKAFYPNSKTFTSIYPIIQLGIGLPKFNNKDGSNISGTYVGLGIGTTLNEHFLVEILFSSICKNINTLTDSDNSTFTTIVGYKFSL